MDKIIYSKYSNERDAQFSICTDILLLENQEKLVRKRPIGEKAKAHVANLGKWFDELSNIYPESQMKMNRCHMNGHAAEFEFLDGATLENELDDCLYQGEKESFLNKIGEFFQILESAKNQSEFAVTEEFEHVFGKAELPGGLMSTPVTDVDLIFNNVIKNHSLQVIDYEWTFDFPIPIHFVMYRALHYYLFGSSTRMAAHEMRLFSHFGISEEEQSAYAQMEKNFQNYIQGKKIPIRQMYDAISPGTLPVMEWAAEHTQLRNRQKVQIFWNIDGKFDEANSVTVQMTEEGLGQGTVIIPAGVDYIRLDPGEQFGVLKITKLQVNGMDVTVSDSNGTQAVEDTFFFSSMDPQIYFACAAEESQLTFELIMEPLPMKASEITWNVFGKMEETIAEQERKIESLQAKNRGLKQKIRDMENTKVWKAYQKYRDKVEKRK